MKYHFSFTDVISFTKKYHYSIRIDKTPTKHMFVGVLSFIFLLLNFLLQLHETVQEIYYFAIDE